MKPYSHSNEPSQDNLIELPRLQETLGYDVLDGDPRCSIRIDRGTQHSASRLGVWMCTPGIFCCTEKGDELQTIIEGSLTIILEDGSSFDFGPGDSFFTEKGERVTWKINETVKKVFFTYDSAA